MKVNAVVISLVVVSIHFGSSLESDIEFWADTPTPTVITVAWLRLKDAGTDTWVGEYKVAYRLTNGTDEPIIIYKTTTTRRLFQSVSIRGLKPVTSYEYAVVAGNTSIQENGFKWPWQAITTRAFMETTFQLSSSTPTTVTVNWQYRNATDGERPEFFEIPYMVANSSQYNIRFMNYIPWHEGNNFTQTLTDLFPDTSYKVVVLSDVESKRFRFIHEYPWKTVKTLY